eukprot:scaffold445107_cov41-Prasinocladus_malaysianus.AAC.1
MRSPTLFVLVVLGALAVAASARSLPSEPQGRGLLVIPRGGVELKKYKAELAARGEEMPEADEDMDGMDEDMEDENGGDADYDEGADAGDGGYEEEEEVEYEQ